MEKPVANRTELGLSSNVPNRTSKGLVTDRDGFLFVHPAKPLNIYDEFLTYSRKSVLQDDFTYGINTDVLNLQENNSATAVWNMDGAVLLNSNTDPAGAAVITTKDFIKSQSDEGIDVYITAAFGTPTTNNIQEIGLGSQTDGVFFCQDENGLYVFTRNNSVDTVITRANWNVDRLDGTGPSAMLLDPTKLNVYRIEFVNNCCFAFYVKNDRTPEWNLVHKIQVGNKLADLPLRISNNFICIVSRNVGASLGQTLKVTNFSVYNSGDFKIRGPLRSYFTTLTLSTRVPVLSYQNKTTFNGIPNKITAFMQLLSAATDGTKNVILELCINPVLTGPSWVDFDTPNSPIQYDETATALTGGRTILSLVIGKVDSKTVNLDDFNVKISPGDIITIACQSSNSSDVSTSMVFKSNV